MKAEVLPCAACLHVVPTGQILAGGVSRALRGEVNDLRGDTVHTCERAELGLNGASAPCPGCSAFLAAAHPRFGRQDGLPARAALASARAALASARAARASTG